jgi:PAS domain S-box-containing protein
MPARTTVKTQKQLLRENADLRARLEEAEETLQAIRSGQVDALIVSAEHGDQIYTLKGAEQPYHIFVDEMNEGALTLTATGTILYCNSRFAALLNISIDHILGKPLTRFLVPQDWTKATELVQQGIQSEGKGELMLAGNEKQIPVEISLHRVILEGEPRLGVIVSDISERKRMELGIRALNASLEKRVAERTTELTIANAQLEAEIVNRKVIEQELRQSERKYSLLFESVAIPISLSKLSTNVFVDVNEQFEKLFGYTKSEIVGKTSLELGIAKLEERDSTIAEVKQKGLQRGKEKYVRTKSGEERIVSLNARTLELDGKQYALSTMEDITERRRAEEALHTSQERMRFALEASHIGAWDLDLSDHTAFRSLEHDRIFGYAEMLPEWTYEKFIEHVTAEDCASVNAKFRHAIENQSDWNFECRIRRADGQVRWIWATGRHQMNAVGNPTRMTGIIQDITERKRAEEEIHKLNAELEQRVHQRTMQLESANKELEAFAYSVSHDLRAPLRGIDGWSLALLEDYGSQLDSQAQTYLHRVRSETQRMSQLIDDLLQLSRLTRAEMRTEQVDLSVIAQTYATRLQEEAPERATKFTIQTGLVVNGDPRLLEIALSNLLNNAFKFTGKIAQAHIEFGQTEAQGKRTFFVHDNGVGFDMTYAEKLFSAFHRLHKATEFPGTGIGLATVQRIIHRHGGRVWAEAYVNQGATFYFTLEEER